MSASSRRFNKARALAAQWRAEHREIPPGGYMLLFRMKVIGWTKELSKDRLRDWQPGVLAVAPSPIDQIFEATGGNEMDGASEWSIVFDPAPSDIVLRPEMAVLGWSIIAKKDGVDYMVEAGLRSPEARLKFWQRNLHVIRAAIEKTDARPRPPSGLPEIPAHATFKKEGA